MNQAINQADTKKQLPGRHQQLLNIIPFGKENAITVSTIISQIGGSSVHIRSMIAELITQYGEKIGSYSKGFFIIQSPKEKQMAVAMLASRRNELDKRIKALQEAPTKEQMAIHEVEPEAVR